MLPEAVSTIVGQLPYMHRREAEIFYDLISKNRLRAGLELGFFHGVSSTYIAGALEENDPPGHLTTIDLLTAKTRSPNIEELLCAAGLRDLVTIFFEEKSFNWRLLQFLRDRRHGSFDFCYLDGAHTWYDTGFAFLLVEKLLAPGGWAVFDDVYFSFRESNNRDKPWVRRMPEEEQTTQQVLHVFELLVEDNPSFTNFRRMSGRLAFAQKKDPSVPDTQYLPQHLAVSVSRALERAQRDPEFRNQLLYSPDAAMAEVHPSTGPLHPTLRFVESDSEAPLPAVYHQDSSFTIPMERAAWDRTKSRNEIIALFEDIED